MESEKRPYAFCTGTTKGKQPHSSLSVQKIKDLYVLVGWIGRRRRSEPHLKVAPYIDRGPGPA